jgi:DNA-binding CsgD family transcriptional regulator
MTFTRLTVFHEGDEAHQGGELVLVLVLGGIRPGLVRDPTGRVGDAGALLRQLQGGALDIGEHRGLPPVPLRQTMCSASRNFSAYSVLPVRVSPAVRRHAVRRPAGEIGGASCDGGRGGGRVCRFGDGESSVTGRVDSPVTAGRAREVRDAMGQQDFDTAWAEGERLSIDEGIAYAQRRHGERKRPTSGWESLTPTERDVIRLVSDGLSNKDIATRLFVSPRTVQTHLTHVYTKLGLTSRMQLAQEAARHT